MQILGRVFALSFFCYALLPPPSWAQNPRPITLVTLVNIIHIPLLTDSQVLTMDTRFCSFKSDANRKVGGLWPQGTACVGRPAGCAVQNECGTGLV